MIKAFIQGWKIAFRSWRIAAIVYLLQFLLALVLGMMVYSELGSSIGNSLELKKLLTDYDHTVLSDLNNIHGGFQKIITSGLPWLILIWLIASVFISGGLLFSIDRKQYTWEMFWAGGARYFFSFLKIGLVFLGLFLLVTAIWIPLAGNFDTIIPALPSEREYAFIIIFVLVLYLLFVLFLWGSATAAKFFKIKENTSIWQSIKKGFGWTWRHFTKVEGLLILFAFAQMGVVALYWLIEGASGMVSPTLIWVFFFIQQVFVFFRILWRIGVYGGVEALLTPAVSHE